MPTLLERQWLRSHRRVYKRPELFPDEALAVAKEAVRMGYRHPCTSVFAWPIIEAQSAPVARGRRAGKRNRPDQ